MRWYIRSVSQIRQLIILTIQKLNEGECYEQ
jgi:hypothetical protein